MITVSGQTFQHRDVLKLYYGKWNATDQNWQFDRRMTASELERLRGLVGCIVTESTPEKPKPRPTPRPDAPNPFVGQELMEALAAIDAAFGEPAVISWDLAADDQTPGPRDYRPSKTYGDDNTYLNYFRDHSPKAFFGFSSLSKFVAYVESIPKERQRAGHDDDQQFTGSVDMGEALDLASNGWRDGVKQAEETLELLDLDNAQTPRRNRTIAGGVVNVGAMLSGNPKHMVKRAKSPGRKVVTFFVEAGASANIKADSLIDRAAIIAAIIDKMESVGYSCAVVAVDTSTWGTETIYQLAVQLKESGERLNLSDLIFALGHPSFLRRMSFAACSSVEETRSIWQSQGSESNAFDKEHRCGKSEFYVPVLNRNATTGDPLELLPHVVPDGLPIKLKVNR